MSYIREEELDGILKDAPPGSDKKGIIKGLISRGHTIQNINAVPTEQGLVEEPLLLSGGIPKAIRGGIQAIGEAVRSRYPGKVSTGLTKAVELGSELAPIGPLEKVTQAVAGEAVLNPALQAAGKKVIGFLGEKFGAAGPEVMDILQKKAPDVVKYARMGKEKAAEVSAALAKKLGNFVEAYETKAGEEYRKMLVKALGNKAEHRIDLPKATKAAIDGVRSEFGYATEEAAKAAQTIGFQTSGGAVKAVVPPSGTVKRITSPDEVKIFNRFADLVDEYGMATPEQAYYLQRDLTSEIRRQAGKPLAKALSELKKPIVDSLPELGTANKSYRQAMELVDDLSGFANADDKMGFIMRSFRNRGEKRDAILKLASASEEAKKALDNSIAAFAGKNLAGWSQFMPKTGYTAGAYLAGAGGIEAAREGHPGYAAAMMAALPFTSPRLVAEGVAAFSRKWPQKLVSSPAMSALRKYREENP